MLTRTGLIGSTKAVAGLIRLGGTLIILAAAGASFFYAFFPAESEI
jgi:hypothetical protein